MKKLLYSILALVLVLFIGIYCVLFTGFGNNFVKNIAEKKLNENSNIAIKIEEFELGISKINLKVLVNAMLEAKVNGDFSLLSQSLDVKYELNGKNLELLKITDPLNIAGNIKGNFSDFNIDGKGVIFTSPLTLDANVKDYFPTKLNLDANNLDVEKLSKIAGVDYASGFINLNANVNEFDKDKLDAKALISIYSELKLKPSITKDFGIDISRFGKVIIDSKNTYKANEITPNLQIKSNILNLTSNFEPINLTNQVIKGQVITNLSELAFINPTLNSNLKITSDILYKDKVANINSVLSGKNINTKLTKVTINQENTTISTDLRANAELVRLQGGELINLVANAKLGKSGLENADIKGLLLGANSNITLGKNDLNASIKGLKSLALLGLLNQDKMLDADINIDAKLSDLKNLVGNANLEINGKTVPSYFKKAYDLDVNSKVNANANIKLSGAENITLDAKLITDLVDSFNANGTYKKGIVNANYNASANLANFNKMLNKNMSGNIAVQGDLVFDKILNLTLNSNEFFGGKLNAKLNGDKFNANLSNVALENLAKSFDLIDVYKANVNGNLDYDLKQASGKLIANLGKGHLKYHKTIKLINTILNTDVTKVVFDKGDVLVNINKNLIDYNANISATNAKIAVSNGTYNTLSKVINASILVSFNNNEVKGKIAGIDEDVKFIPDAKNTVENAVKVLDKLTGKNNSEKLNETLKPAENLLKGLFKR
ncbi:hypothetical protein AVANS_0228 [Campylobacter sp. RM5004]|uniref:hypothetical protein n=1 Tax=Campylobacter sp. RM5004 TaxID=1660078 RepID=UPI001EFA5504|nr:hypothetical protein [Campylobacter sp. RM5004]ULO00872.1 hypothetical protein AVANS_0228 [Campylobacter sp. RM5004]